MEQHIRSRLEVPDYAAGGATCWTIVAAVIYPRLLTACALQGMKNGLELLQQSLDSGKVVDRPDALVSFEELHDIMGMHEVEELEQRFLTPEQLEAKYGRERKASIMPDPKPAPKEQTA